MTRAEGFPQPVDVLVAGGGIAGSVAALAFCREGLSTALLGDPGPEPPGDAYGQRVSSINRASQRYLEALGVWPRIAAGRVSPFDRIEVWSGKASLTFDAADVGLDHFACILENDLVAGAAREALVDRPEFQSLPPGRVAAIETRADALEIVTDKGVRVTCRLLIGADGANSTVRALSGIERKTYDYDQKAIVARVRPAQAHGQTARQAFLASGPLAFLPLADDSCSIVWSLYDSVADEVLELGDEAFADRLELAFDSRLGRIESVEARAAFPLRRSHADRYAAPRTALVGDACHTVHPLAGLGANQGIADVEALLDAVRRARAHRQQYWLPRVLSRYQRSRRTRNAAVLAAMDVFHLGFANESSIFRPVRQGIFRLVDSSPAAKRFFIAQASGFAP